MSNTMLNGKERTPRNRAAKALLDLQRKYAIVVKEVRDDADFYHIINVLETAADELRLPYRFFSS